MQSQLNRKMRNSVTFVVNDLPVNGINVGLTQVQMNQTNEGELLPCLGTMSVVVPDIESTER